MNGVATGARRVGWALAALAALALAASLYFDPHFALDLAARAWACF